MFKLPPPATRDIAVERDLRIPTRDGVILLADHYSPLELEGCPTILIRSVYTDRLKAGWQCELIAQQGFHVLIVSGRGVCGSGGRFAPFVTEGEDGRAVIEWLNEKDWFKGELGTCGASYLGYTQWAVAESAGDSLKAMSTQFIGSDLRSMVYPGGGFALELWIWWLSMIETQEKSILRTMWNTLAGSRQRTRIARHVPLGEIDRLVTGKKYEFWHDWLEHENTGDPWWDRGDFRPAVPRVEAPNHLVGGWYDFMLPGLIRDYETLAAAGKKPYLTVGPWTHFDTKASKTGTQEAIVWLRAHLLGETSRLRNAPVRIYVMGAGEWRDYDSWPPPGTESLRWYLQPREGLIAEPPLDAPHDSFHYDPADPTPSVGGAARSFGQGRASKDNRMLEARPDVLTYTSEPLSRDLEVIGRANAELFVTSTVESTDFFVRLCDVNPSGRSMNVCDGLFCATRVTAPPDEDGIARVDIELCPTAYRFRKGHRVRAQISSGCFPRWNRNLGAGESLITATRSSRAEVAIYHDPQHPSSITVPVLVT